MVMTLLLLRDMGELDEVASLAERGALMYRQVNKEVDYYCNGNIWYRAEGCDFYLDTSIQNACPRMMMRMMIKHWVAIADMGDA